MNKKIIISFLALGLTTHTAFAEEQGLLETEHDRISYSVGYQLGENFRQQGASFDTEMLRKGIDDALAQTNPLLSLEQRQAALTALKQQLTETQKQRIEEIAQKNLEASHEFLADNAEQEGVTTLPSGLQYKEISSGEGKSPAAEDKVTVHYTGKLINGSVFDSSHDRNQPATFQVNKVIPGWTEALQLMQEGDKWELFIPPELAYGEKGAGRKIPANSALIFEVELISVN
jgi:FKBP-type peptidyl-prolyl cis-trans isomerase FklB